MKTLFASVFLLFSFAAGLPVESRGQDTSVSALPWAQFRGPDGGGVAASDDVIFKIEPADFALWRTDSPETGWSSPVTDGKLLWMTAARTAQASAQEKAAKLAGAKFAMIKDVVAKVDLFAICIDAATGKVVHRIDLATIDSPNAISPMNSFASPTGVWVGDRVVMHFGRYGTFCLDAASGQLIWRRALVIDDSVGPGSSVVHHRGIIVIPCDGMDQQFVAGLSLETGEEVWRTPRPPMDAPHGEFRKAYSSPLLVDVDGQTQAVVPGAQWCAAYDPADGREIWRMRHGNGFSVSPMPIYVDGKVIFSTGYGGKELIAIDPSGSGDVTGTHVLWRSKKGVPMMPSAVAVGSQLYTIAEGGILASLDVNDGTVLWQKRLGGNYSASPLASGDRVIIGDHDGNVTVFRAGADFQPIARYELGEQIMASPVPLGDDLILRTAAAVYRFADSTDSPADRTP